MAGSTRECSVINCPRSRVVPANNQQYAGPAAVRRPRREGTRRPGACRTKTTVRTANAYRRQHGQHHASHRPYRRDYRSRRRLVRPRTLVLVRRVPESASFPRQLRKCGLLNDANFGIGALALSFCYWLAARAKAFESSDAVRSCGPLAAARTCLTVSSRDSTRPVIGKP